MEGIRVCNAILTRVASNLKAARARVVLQTDLGTTLFELGDSIAAEEHLREALRAVRELAERHPENRQLQRDLSVALFRLADVLVSRADGTSEALELSQEAVKGCRALCEWDPANFQWRRHLAMSRISLGDVRLARGEIALARGDYEFAVGTMGALAALERENLQGQRLHAAAERKLAGLASKAGDHHEAVAALERAVVAMRRACAGVNSERWHRELRELEDALHRARSDGGA